MSSVTNEVYEKLRADLLTCRLAPGQKLKIEEMCKQLSAGSSSVREALSRLSSEGLVVMEPQRGFRVAPLEMDELLDLTRVRSEIEALCIRDAIANGGLEWEGQIVATCHRLLHTPHRAAGDEKRYEPTFILAHNAFHAAVVSACTSPWLLKLRELLYDRQERYRFLSLPLATYPRDLNKEHSEIAEAVLARDADLAVARMTSHIKATAEILMGAAEQQLGAQKPKRARKLASA